jgi:hypothetical protein
LIFKYKDKCDFAYLILKGQLNFYKYDFRELKYQSLEIAKPANAISNELSPMAQSPKELNEKLSKVVEEEKSMQQILLERSLKA